MKNIIILLAFCLMGVSVCAETMPVKIVPDQVISTCYDEVQVGDSIKFKVASNGVLVKGTPIVGIVDFVSDNGNYYDSAQIDIKKFRYRDEKGKIIEINSPLSINGFEILKYKSNRTAQFFNYIGIAFRGKEIEILPQDNIEFVIWIGN